MKHIKLFKEIKKPEIDDYVLADINDRDKEYQSFINQSIGRIKTIYKTTTSFAIVE